MKINPVVSPVVPQPSNTGSSPDKLQRLKAIAEGKQLEEEKNPEAPIATQKEVAHTLQTIAMKTNHNPTEVPADLVQAVSDAAAAEGTALNAEEQPKSTVSDMGVQASEVSEATQPLSPQLAALARQRRALQVKEKELKDRERALTGPSRSELESRIKSEPLSVLQELGVTYDKLTQDILAAQGQYNPEIDKLKAEIEALKNGTEERFSNAQKAQDESAVNYVADKLEALIGNGDEFELLKEAGGIEEVVTRVFLHWKKTGRELDIAKVAREYQEELAEEAARYAKLKMVQGKLTPTEPLKSQAQPVPGMKTLTNKDSARPVMDRRQRAILAATGHLRK